MRGRGTWLAALAVAFLLGGCTGGGGALKDERPGGLTSLRIAGELRDLLRQRREGPPALTVTRAELAEAGVTQPFMILRLEDGAAAGMFPVASNRGHLQWRTPDGIGVTGRGGIVAATQGLGGDLLSAETEPLLRALAEGRSARYRRVLRRLDGEGVVLVQPYDCTLSLGGEERVVLLGRAHPTRRSEERCRPIAPSLDRVAAAYRAEPFTNRYNVGDGTIWLSRQYVGPAVGHVVLERIIE